MGVLPYPERVDSWSGMRRAGRWIDAEQGIWTGLVDYSREGLWSSHWVNGDLMDVEPADDQATRQVLSVP